MTNKPLILSCDGHTPSGSFGRQNQFIHRYRRDLFFVVVVLLLIHQFQFVNASLFITCNGCCFYQDLNQVLRSIHICCVAKHTHTHTHIIGLSLFNLIVDASTCLFKISLNISHSETPFIECTLYFRQKKEINAFYRNQDKQRKRWIVSMNE